MPAAESPGCEEVPVGPDEGNETPDVEITGEPDQEEIPPSSAGPSTPSPPVEMARDAYAVKKNPLLDDLPVWIERERERTTPGTSSSSP
eukprot:7972833-Pyramimonas_sp.AAC.1